MTRQARKTIKVPDSATDYKSESAAITESMVDDGDSNPVLLEDTTDCDSNDSVTEESEPEIQL